MVVKYNIFANERQPDRQAGGQAGRQVGGLAGRQVGRHITTLTSMKWSAVMGWLRSRWSHWGLGLKGRGSGRGEHSTAAGSSKKKQSRAEQG